MFDANFSSHEQKTYVEGELRVLQSREMAHRIHTDDSVTEQELINMGMPEAVRDMRPHADMHTRMHMYMYMYLTPYFTHTHICMHTCTYTGQGQGYGPACRRPQHTRT